MAPARRPCDGLGFGRIACFRLGRRDVSDRFVQSSAVEPVHPFEGGVLDGSTPASIGRSVVGIETYWMPRSL